VVTDKRRSTRAGRFVEEVGFYNPLTKEKVLKSERLKYWISVGAKPSATIQNLLISEKITEGKKIPVHKKAKKERSLAKTMEDKEEKKAMSADLSAEAKVEVQKPAVEIPVEKKAEEVKEDVSSEALAKEEKPADEQPVQEKIKKETPKRKEKQKEAPKTE
jgi:small subunit ribosomal protein S16